MEYAEYRNLRRTFFALDVAVGLIALAVLLVFDQLVLAVALFMFQTLVFSIWFAIFPSRLRVRCPHCDAIMSPQELREGSCRACAGSDSERRR